MGASATSEVEWLPRSSGIGSAVALWVALGVYAVLTLVDGPTAGDVAPLLLGVGLAVLAWVALVRPRVGLGPDALVLQGMTSRVAVPWSMVEDVAIRHVLLVFTSEGRYVSPALSRPRRRRSLLARNDRERSGTDTADHLVERLRHRAREAGECAGTESRAVQRDRDVAVLVLLGACVLASLLAALAV